MLAFNFLGKNLPSVKTSEAQMFVRALPVYKGPKELTRVYLRNWRVEYAQVFLRDLFSLALSCLPTVIAKGYRPSEIT